MSADYDISDVVQRAIDHREAAYESAIRALAKYKFTVFGYYAAGWVNYNRLLKGTPWHQGNPLKQYVTMAAIGRGELNDAAAWMIHQGKKAKAQLLGELGAVARDNRAADYCPQCGSSNIEGGSVEIGRDTATQEVGCNECNAEWYDDYTLTGSRQLETGHRPKRGAA